MTEKIAIVGAGVMGEMIATSACAHNFCDQNKLVIIEHDSTRRELMQKRFPSAEICALSRASLGDCALCILSIKPQDFTNVVPSVVLHLRSTTTIVSIMAGVPVERISHEFGGHSNVVRAMPNLATRVGKSMTVYFCEKKVPKEKRDLTQKLLKLFGEALEVSDESLLNVSTAVSGTGPAYFFYIVEQLQIVAQELGFDEANAKQLVLQTMEGAHAMLSRETLTAGELRARVTSKGGTTEAAFAVLDQGKFGVCLREAVHAACRRALELSGKINK